MTGQLLPGGGEAGGGVGMVPVDHPGPGGKREQFPALSLVDQGEEVLARGRGHWAARLSVSCGAPAATVCHVTRASRTWLEAQRLAAAAGGEVRR